MSHQVEGVARLGQVRPMYSLGAFIHCQLDRGVRLGLIHIASLSSYKLVGQEYFHGFRTGKYLAESTDQRFRLIG